jgi:DnaJ family protein C protein 28
LAKLLPWTDNSQAARQQGHFRNLKGRGKPLILSDEERNPFISREEFFMNRIIKKNKAAPPWVELQSGI